MDNTGSIVPEISQGAPSIYQRFFNRNSEYTIGRGAFLLLTILPLVFLITIGIIPYFVNIMISFGIIPQLVSLLIMLISLFYFIMLPVLFIKRAWDFGGNGVLMGVIANICGSYLFFDMFLVIFLPHTFLFYKFTWQVFYFFGALMKGIELLTISVLILLIIYLAIRPGNGVSNTRNTQGV